MLYLFYALFFYQFSTMQGICIFSTVISDSPDLQHPELFKRSIQHPVFTVPFSFSLHSLALIPHSSFLISHSSFLIPHSSFLISHSSFLIPHFSFLISHSSFLFPHSYSKKLFIKNRFP